MNSFIIFELMHPRSRPFIRSLNQSGLNNWPLAVICLPEDQSWKTLPLIGPQNSWMSEARYGGRYWRLWAPASLWSTKLGSGPNRCSILGAWEELSLQGPALISSSPCNRGCATWASQTYRPSGNRRDIRHLWSHRRKKWEDRTSCRRLRRWSTGRSTRALRWCAGGRRASRPCPARNSSNTAWPFISLY